MYVRDGISAALLQTFTPVAQLSERRASNATRQHSANAARNAAIIGRADGRKRRCEQLLAHLVGRREATVEIEDNRFGRWHVTLNSNILSHDDKSKGRSKAIERVE